MYSSRGYKHMQNTPGYPTYGCWSMQKNSSPMPRHNITHDPKQTLYPRAVCRTQSREKHGVQKTGQDVSHGVSKTSLGWGSQCLTHPSTHGEVSVPKKRDVVAVDCEMVGVGRKRRRNMLARVAIVNMEGAVLLDEYVSPTEPITDYRTHLSGIRAGDLVGARSFKEIKKRVLSMFKECIVVGHSVQNDLSALRIWHPPELTRDTALYMPLRRELAAVHRPYNPSDCPALKMLSEHLLGERIQGGEHCPVEDARAAMKLYVRHMAQWE